MKSHPSVIRNLALRCGTAIVLMLGVLPVKAQVTMTCQSAASDPDGDGFGWENGQSCRVMSLTVCQLSDSDPDGDGFGWENNASCRANQTPGERPVCLNPGSDSDGDGFGWESGRSCVVSVSNTRPTCQLPDSDPDGDGFGWENGSSCNVSGNNSGNPGLPEEPYSLPHPACSDARFDPDSSGYGWENSLTCTTRNYGDGGKSITDVVLVTGQSNALGAETVIQEQGTYNESLDTPVHRVYAYTNTGWTIAGLRQIWDLGWYPRADIASDPANNFAFHFAKALVRSDANKVIGLIMVTAPGESISHWDKGQAFQQTIAARVNQALNALPKKTAIDAVLWHQGETDYYDTSYYGDKLTQLIGNFRAESWVQNQYLFICGETLNSPVNARLRALNSDADARTGCVSAQGLDSVGDNLHFSTASMRMLGGRYADKYLELSGAQ